MRAPVLARLALPLLLVIGLSGCIKQDITAAINSDGLVSGSMTQSIDFAQMASMAGSMTVSASSDGTSSGGSTSKAPTPEEIKAKLDEAVAEAKAQLSDQQAGFPPGTVLDVTARDDKEMVITATFTDLTEEQFSGFLVKAMSSANNDGDSSLPGTDTASPSSAPEAKPEASLTRADGKDTFSLMLPGDPQSQMFSGMFPDSTVQITFAGPVESSNGTVDGTTVRWTFKPGQEAKMTAVAAAGTASPPIALIGLVALVALVLAGGVWFVMRRRPGQPLQEPDFSEPGFPGAGGGQDPDQQMFQAPRRPGAPPAGPAVPGAPGSFGGPGTQ